MGDDGDDGAYVGIRNGPHAEAVSRYCTVTIAIIVQRCYAYSGRLRICGFGIFGLIYPSQTNEFVCTSVSPLLAGFLHAESFIQIEKAIVLQSSVPKVLEPLQLESSDVASSLQILTVAQPGTKT